MAILHTYRTKNGHETKKLTPVQMIRQGCLDCCSWQPKEVELCPLTDCPVWPLRLGKKPRTKRTDRKAS